MLDLSKSSIQPDYSKLLLFGFVKFGKYEHLKALQNGSLYCNSLQYFANIDEIDGVGDRYETVTKQMFGITPTIDLKDGDYNNNYMVIYKFPDGSCQTLQYNTDFFANLFCLYSVTAELGQDEYRIDLPTELSANYQYQLLIRDSKEFINRVVKSLRESKRQFMCGLIEYKNFANYSGKKTYFQKPLKYSYQNEYRILIKNFEDAPLIINIGSIQDISDLCLVNDIKKIKIVRNDSAS